MSIYSIIFMTGAYLLGAVPFAVVVGRLFYHTDIRKHGSGNPGATNMLRTLGTRAGLIVLLLDMAKGFIPVLLARYFLDVLPVDPHTTYNDNMVIAGALAILGHIFSPFLRFKGGKGVATTVGVILALEPFFALIVIATFIVILLMSRFVSLSSIIASFVFTILMLAFRAGSPVYLVFGVGLTLLIVIKHRANILRLLKGEENRFVLKKAR